MTRSKISHFLSEIPQNLSHLLKSSKFVKILQIVQNLANRAKSCKTFEIFRNPLKSFEIFRNLSKSCKTFEILWNLWKSFQILKIFENLTKSSKFLNLAKILQHSRLFEKNPKFSRITKASSHHFFFNISSRDSLMKFLKKIYVCKRKAAALTNVCRGRKCLRGTVSCVVRYVITLATSSWTLPNCMGDLIHSSMCSLHLYVPSVRSVRPL